jgi:hypothetical protein
VRRVVCGERREVRGEGREARGERREARGEACWKPKDDHNIVLFLSSGQDTERASTA